MTISLNILLPLVSIFALISLIMHRHHLLMCLLSLEATILSLAFMISLSTGTLSSSLLFYCIVILSFGACEAAVALSVLVIISRACGSDIMKSFNTNKC